MLGLAINRLPALTPASIKTSARTLYYRGELVKKAGAPQAAGNVMHDQVENGDWGGRTAGEKVAVMGGTGFLSSHVAPQFLETAHTPVVVAKTPDKRATVLAGVQVKTTVREWTDDRATMAWLRTSRRSMSEQPEPAPCSRSESQDSRKGALWSSPLAQRGQLGIPGEGGNGKEEAASTRAPSRGCLDGHCLIVACLTPINGLSWAMATGLARATGLALGLRSSGSPWNATRT